MAVVGGLPFVVGLGQDGAGQAQQRCGIGERADDVGAGVISLFSRSAEWSSTRSFSG
jgi:hypothetical protein